MQPCRTRPSMSPTETSSSTSGPRSSPAATSRRRSPTRSGATSTSRRASRDGFDDVVVRVGRRHGPQGPVHRRPCRRVAATRRTSAPSTTASGADARASTSSTSSARPDGGSVDAEGKPAGWRGHLGIGDVRYGSGPEGVDARRRRDASTSSATRSRRALRHGRPLRPPADRGGARHLARRRRGNRREVPAMTGRPQTAARQPIRVRGLRKSYGKQVVLDGIDLDVAGGHRVRPARPERRRQDDRDPHPLDAHLAPTPARCGRRASTSRASPTRVRALDRPHRPGLGGRRPVHRRGEPAPDGRPAPPAEGRGPPAGRGAARAVRSRRCRRQARHDLLGRHAPPAGPGHDARRRPADHLPRRADDRARPAQPAGHVGHRARARRGAASRSSSRRSTSRRPTGSRTGSRCSTAAGSSPRARPPSSSGSSPAAASASSSATSRARSGRAAL